MSHSKYIHLILISLICCKFGYSQLVTNAAELQSAISSATAGTEIIMRDGIWSDIIMNINADGTSTAPVIIRAETSGQVFLTGDSRINLGGSYVYLEGLVFKDGIPTDKQVIRFRYNSLTPCDHCKMVNITFDDYNAAGTSNLKWVRLFGTFNEVSHCSFLDKSSIGSCVLVERDTLPTTPPDYHSIHHNYFAFRRPQDETFNNQNDQDAIRIGNSKSSLTDSRTAVFDNLFHDWIGEIEVISSKAGDNKFYNNTFRDHAGLLTLRHGNGSEVFSNFFFPLDSLKSGGIRIIGEDHSVYNNYVEGSHLSGSRAAGAIVIANGLPNTPVNGYAQVKNLVLVHNTIVNAEKGIRVGAALNTTTHTLAPSNIIIEDNIMLNTTDAIEIYTAPIGSSLIEHNMRQGGTWDATLNTSNQVVTSDLLNGSADGYKRITAASPAVNSTMGGISRAIRDITGGIRPTAITSRDKGAEELEAIGQARPYTTADVGILIGAGSGSLSHCYPLKLDLYQSRLDNQNYKSDGTLWSTSDITLSGTTRFVTEESAILDIGFSVLSGSILEVALVGNCDN